MDDFKNANTVNDGEEEVNRNEELIHQGSGAEEIREPSSQSPTEESTSSSQGTPTSEPPVEIQGVVFVEKGTGASFENDRRAVSGGSDVSLQGWMDGRVYQNHERSTLVSKKPDKQTSPAFQPVKLIEQTTSYEGDIDSSSLGSDKTAITSQARIFYGSHQTVEVAPEESETVPELSRMLTNDVGCVPATSLQDNISVEETTSPPKSMRFVTGRPREHIFKTKFPVHDYCDSSAQIPSPGIQTTQFVLERHYPSVSRNEIHISVHFLASQDFSQGELCAIISRMEEQPGTRLVPFCVEHVGLQESPRYLNEAFIADQVKVRFQLVNEVERNLRFKDHSMAERVITAPQIQSLSQRCIESPGAVAEVCVEFVDEVGQLCQDYLRIILDYDDSSQNLLLPIWVVFHSIVYQYQMRSTVHVRPINSELQL